MHVVKVLAEVLVQVEVPDPETCGTNGYTHECAVYRKSQRYNRRGKSRRYDPNGRAKRFNRYLPGYG